MYLRTGLYVENRLRAPFPIPPSERLGCGIPSNQSVSSWPNLEAEMVTGRKGISFITDQQLEDKISQKQANLWVGRGFDWTPVHFTQRIYEIKRADPEQFYPPKPIMWLMEQWTGEQVGGKHP